MTEPIDLTKLNMYDFDLHYTDCTSCDPDMPFPCDCDGPAIVAALRALVARKNAALNASADALDSAETLCGLHTFKSARDAARAAAQEKSGSQPSPPEDASGRGIAPSTAAGDLSPQERVEYRAFLRKMSADRIEESHMADGDLSQVNKDVLADARRLDALADRMEKK